MFDDTMNNANETPTENTAVETAVDVVVESAEESVECPECVGCPECEKLRAANTELEAGIAVVSVAMTFISVIVGLVTWMFAMKKYYKGDNK